MDRAAENTTPPDENLAYCLEMISAVPQNAAVRLTVSIPWPFEDIRSLYPEDMSVVLRYPNAEMLTTAFTTDSECSTSLSTQHARNDTCTKRIFAGGVPIT